MDEPLGGSTHRYGEPARAMPRAASRIYRLVSGAVFVTLIVSTFPCDAQDRDREQAQQAGPSDTPPDEQTLITREEWQRRIAAAKERLRLSRAQGFGLRPAKSDQDIEQENSERAMSDDMLMPGDIVSTNRGFLTFKGRPGDQRKPEEDFVPAQR